MNIVANNRGYRPLIIAEAANPEWTSVPLVGWNIARALARKTDAHLVTHVRNRDAILRAGLIEGTDFTAIDNEAVAAPMYRIADRLRGGDGKGWTTIMAFSSLAYYSFELAVWRKFKDRIAAGEFDLVHRVTPLSPISQSLIASKAVKAGTPFIVGPLNGGVPWPKGFTGRRHAEKEWLSYVRGAYRLMPAYNTMRKNAAAIIVASRHTLSEMPASVQHKCTLIQENGVDEKDIVVRPSRAKVGPLKAIFVGRLVPYKGADMLISAAAPFLLRGTLSLDIVGDGPQRPDLERIVDELGVRAHVKFHSWLPHAETMARLGSSDILLLPSVREFGGGVVVEAMARGATPIVADYAGPSELVDDATGIRVPFHDQASLTGGIRNAIARVINNPDILANLSAAGQEKVRRDLTWQAKADKILRVYDSVLRSRPVADRAAPLPGAR